MDEIKEISLKHLAFLTALLSTEAEMLKFTVTELNYDTEDLRVYIRFPKTLTKEEKLAFATRIITTLYPPCSLWFPVETGIVTMLNSKWTGKTPRIQISILG
jgi:hypothetical protein